MSGESSYIGTIGNIVFYFFPRYKYDYNKNVNVKTTDSIIIIVSFVSLFGTRACTVVI